MKLKATQNVNLGKVDGELIHPNKGEVVDLPLEQERVQSYVDLGLLEPLDEEETEDKTLEDELLEIKGLGSATVEKLKDIGEDEELQKDKIKEAAENDEIPFAKEDVIEELKTL